MDFVQQKSADAVALKVVIGSGKIGLNEKLHTAVKADHALIIFEVAADKFIFDLIENIDVFVIILELCAGIGTEIAGAVKVSAFPDKTEFRNIFPALFAPEIGGASGGGEVDLTFGAFDKIGRFRLFAGLKRERCGVKISLIAFGVLAGNDEFAPF